ncbi:phosphoserine aminotransferase 2, chloroplastic-like protein [Tanacetum coccineum]
MGKKIRRYDATAFKWKKWLRPKIAAFTAVYERVKQMDENGSSDLVVFQNALTKYETQGKEFMSIIQKAESDLRKLLDISEDYAVLFLQGGATTQFAAIPLNICKPHDQGFSKLCDQNSKCQDLIGDAQEITPVMLDYKIHADNNSLYNTPPCYGIYMCGLVFEDLLAQGGLVEVEKKNVNKAKVLYDAIDASGGFYRCPVDKSVRSLMNVPFTLEKSDLEGEFVKEAAKEGMVQLKGHRSVGGMRASIYNAMPLAGVEKLVAFMKEFQQKHGYPSIKGLSITSMEIVSANLIMPGESMPCIQRRGSIEMPEVADTIWNN